MNSPTVTIRVKPGSELAKLIAAERATTRSNVSKLLHELADKLSRVQAIADSVECGE